MKAASTSAKKRGALPGGAPPKKRRVPKTPALPAPPTPKPEPVAPYVDDQTPYVDTSGVDCATCWTVRMCTNGRRLQCRWCLNGSDTAEVGVHSNDADDPE